MRCGRLPLAYPASREMAPAVSTSRTRNARGTADHAGRRRVTLAGLLPRPAADGTGQAARSKPSVIGGGGRHAPSPTLNNHTIWQIRLGGFSTPPASGHVWAPGCHGSAGDILRTDGSCAHDSGASVRGRLRERDDSRHHRQERQHHGDSGIGRLSGSGRGCSTTRHRCIRRAARPCISSRTPSSGWGRAAWTAEQVTVAGAT